MKEILLQQRMNSENNKKMKSQGTRKPFSLGSKEDNPEPLEINI